jgi:LysM repeat protein
LQAPTNTPTNAERLAQLALQLDAAWNAQNWVEALRLIAEIKAIDPNYDNISEREYFAQVNYGYYLLTQGNCTGAKAAFMAALALRPQGEEALMGLQLLSTYCATPMGPTATPSVAATPTTIVLTAPITYTVKAGDTLYSLSKRYGVTVQAIMQANGLMSSVIRAGQVIWIPNKAIPAVGPIVHVVQPGETLYSIAELYNTTVWAIMAANHLTGTAIWAFRALYIPSPLQPGPIAHVVMPGDTLFTIAKKYNTTVPLIMVANNLKDYAIYVYQKLVIPPEGWTGWPPLTPDGWAGEPTHPGSSATYHVVRAGDTLYGIARRYGVSVAALKAANGLKSDRIYVGMSLRIP